MWKRKTNEWKCRRGRPPGYLEIVPGSKRCSVKHLPGCPLHKHDPLPMHPQLVWLVLRYHDHCRMWHRQRRHLLEAHVSKLWERGQKNASAFNKKVHIELWGFWEREQTGKVQAKQQERKYMWTWMMGYPRVSYISCLPPPKYVSNHLIFDS